MICYKDKTFCVRSESGLDDACHNRECERFLSSDEREKALERGLSIAWCEFYEPGCGWVGLETASER